MKPNTIRYARLSITLSPDVAEKLQRLRDAGGFSASAVVETALEAYFEGFDEPALAARLRDSGATLRRNADERLRTRVAR